MSYTVQCDMVKMGCGERSRPDNPGAMGSVTEDQGTSC